MRCYLLTALALAVLCGATVSGATQTDRKLLQSGSYPIRIIHFNDNHARVDPADTNFNVCKNETVCFGGYARQKTAIDQMKANFTGDVLVLHAGDAFTGTMWDYVYTRNGVQVQPQFLNTLGLDAFTLGNHEFDYGPGIASTFIGNLSVPVISCNIDVSKQPLLAGKVQPYIIKTMPSGLKVGIVGLTPSETSYTASPGPLISFTDELVAGPKCAAQARAAGAQMVIGLTHIGYQTDTQLAALSQDYDLIVGGHSHTLLYSGALPALLVSPPTNETYPLEGPYTTNVNNGGKTIPIVQAAWASRYLGAFDVNFSPKTGLTVTSPVAQPILLGGANSTHSVVGDPAIVAKANSLRGPLDALSASVTGTTNVVLDGERIDVRNAETNLGDLITNSMLSIVNSTNILTKYPNSPIVALMNGGGIRTSLAVGNITRSQVVSVLPFGNTVVVLSASPQALKDSLNNGFSQWTGTLDAAGRFPQVGNIKVSFNPTLPANNRVVKAYVMGRDGKMVDLDALIAANCTNIIVMTNDYMANGGDGYTALKNSTLIVATSQPLDSVVSAYMNATSPITIGTDGRITNCNMTTNATICQNSTQPVPPAPCPSQDTSPPTGPFPYPISPAPSSTSPPTGPFPYPSRAPCIKFNIIMVPGRAFNSMRTITTKKEPNFAACAFDCQISSDCRTLNYDHTTQSCTLYKDYKWFTSSSAKQGVTAGYAKCAQRGVLG